MDTNCLFNVFVFCATFSTFLGLTRLLRHSQAKPDRDKCRAEFIGFVEQIESWLMTSEKPLSVWSGIMTAIPVTRLDSTPVMTAVEAEATDNCISRKGFILIKEFSLISLAATIKYSLVVARCDKWKLMTLCSTDEQQQTLDTCYA